MAQRRIVLNKFGGFMEGINPLQMPAQFAQIDENSDGNKINQYRSRKGWVRCNIPAVTNIALTPVSFRNAMGQICIMLQDGSSSTAALKGYTSPNIWDGT